ncbi:MAG TPA: hypothetical protein VHT70_04535 [Candidatus Saccharimonadales bacterium]|jgi:hypothetical protein|nr:hypothetical protein [Candidatus Saccharimonadales bacterium]
MQPGLPLDEVETEWGDERRGGPTFARTEGSTKDGADRSAGPQPA